MLFVTITVRVLNPADWLTYYNKRLIDLLNFTPATYFFRLHLTNRIISSKASTILCTGQLASFDLSYDVLSTVCDVCEPGPARFNPHMLKVILLTFVLKGEGKTNPQEYISVSRLARKKIPKAPSCFRDQTSQWCYQ